jgi:Ni/Co efflux regulator RcnB
MKRFLTTTALCALVGTFAFGSVASAQSWHGRHDDRNYSRSYDRGYDRGRYDDRGHYDRSSYRGWHDRSDWRRGGYVSRYDWDRGYRVDYRRYHLRQPPYGYEWRRVGDNYVLAAIASGLIASIIVGG